MSSSVSYPLPGSNIVALNVNPTAAAFANYLQSSVVTNAFTGYTPLAGRNLTFSVNDYVSNPIADKKYLLTLVGTNSCVTITGGMTGDYVVVMLQPCDWSWSQTWSWQPLNDINGNSFLVAGYYSWLAPAYGCPNGNYMQQDFYASQSNGDGGYPLSFNYSAYTIQPCQFCMEAVLTSQTIIKNYCNSASSLQRWAFLDANGIRYGQ